MYNDMTRWSTSSFSLLAHGPSCGARIPLEFEALTDPHRINLGGSRAKLILITWHGQYYQRRQTLICSYLLRILVQVRMYVLS